MNDVKTCKRFIRFYPDDLAACETWLAGLAALGLFLSEMGRWRATFEQLEPCATVRYRIEPAMTPQNGLPICERELYDDAGWFYVCTWDKNYHIFRTDDPAAPELQTDPASHALALERILRRLAPAVFALAVLSFWSLSNLWYNVLLPLRASVRYAIERWSLFQIALPLWLTGCTCVYLIPLVRLFRQWRALRRGEPFNHHRRRHALPRGVLAFAVSLAWAAGLLADAFLNMRTYRTIQNTDGLPYVSILELVEEEGLEIPFVHDGFSAHDGGLTEEQNYAYCYQTTHTPWAPTVQFVRQAASKKRGDAYFGAHLEVTRYRMLTQNLAGWLYSELAKEMDSLPDPGCSRAAVRLPDSPEGNYHYFALQDGKTVLYVQSDFDLLDDLDRFTALLE